MWVLIVAGLFLALLFAGVLLVAAPATLSLPPGPRPGLAPLTIEGAVDELRRDGQGEDLVIRAQRMVVLRMQYCRRNGFDSPRVAFARGYGYCVQQALALAEILARLGFQATVVQSLANRFSDGTVGGHAWVRVFTAERPWDIDASSLQTGTWGPSFVPLAEITDLDGFFLGVALWGSPSVNALRYYASGSDSP